ncbi:uncharacterized protein B0H18DRAFT_1007593 [Fomitopsis serialis]|uniref:uncharacterized protein n=1 Tax=Fomitopsis serialis TaxID=139415 RepID=UPI0020081982|nr:uncharacterized protein B0H18DRAFT_1007593 [Neoantrodia serialis]KAH9926028.1 hypothetical protein B0H18DRAFT_1007593 [Neoantrodia serialis]
MGSSADSSLWGTFLLMSPLTPVSETFRRVVREVQEDHQVLDCGFGTLHDDYHRSDRGCHPNCVQCVTGNQNTNLIRRPP